jgi:hypothetical protein
MLDLLATRVRIAQAEGVLAAAPPRQHTLPLQQGAALRVQQEKWVHQKALPALGTSGKAQTRVV